MIAVEMIDGFTLVFCSNHNQTPTRPDGGVEWTTVTRVQILEVRRPHV